MWRVMKYLMLGTGELQNFRNYRIISGYRNLFFSTDNGGTNSYSGWDLGVVELQAVGLDEIMHAEKTLLLY